MRLKPNLKKCLTTPYGVLQHISKSAVVIFLLICQPAFAERPTVLALGDSLTQGYGLAQDDGFVPQLMQWLAEHDTPAHIINAGVSGDTTAGGLARVEWSLTEDVDAMIVALGSNDMLRGISPADIYRNMESILKIGQQRGLRLMIIGVRASGNFGPIYKQDFDAIFPKLANVYHAEYAVHFFENLLDPTQPSQSAIKYLQGDRMHPNKKGVRKAVESIGPIVQQLISE